MNDPLHVGTPLAQIVRSVRRVEDVCDMDTRLVFSSHVHPQPHPHAKDTVAQSLERRLGMRQVILHFQGHAATPS